MNSTVKLRPHNFIPYTLVPNFFIDHHLAKANGEFIKVYLVLLRFMSVGQLDFSLNKIADVLMMTESDVRRALTYFETEGLLTLAFEGNRLREIHLTNMSPNTPTYDTPNQNNSYVADTSNQYEPVYNNTANHPVNHTASHTTNQHDMSYPSQVFQGHESYTPEPEVPMDVSFEEPRRNLKVVNSKPDYSTSEIAYYADQDDFKQLLYITEKYMGKTLSSNDVQTIISFHDWLGLPTDVIELLVEYCVDNDHRHMRYIEKVAIDWADSGINTIEKAKVRTETYNKSYFAILKAYGITDRSPTPKQIKTMDKWLNEYQLDISVITNACERTIEQINKPEMRYTDSILAAWVKEGVRTVSDLSKLPAKPQTNYNNSKKYSNTKKPNNFSNYSQRDYDYDALEKKALEMRLKESNGKRYSS